MERMTTRSIPLPLGAATSPFTVDDLHRSLVHGKRITGVPSLVVEIAWRDGEHVEVEPPAWLDVDAVFAE
jgi:hypothetical protein